MTPLCLGVRFIPATPTPDGRAVSTECHCERHLISFSRLRCRIIIVLDLEVLCGPLEGRLGNAVNIDSAVPAPDAQEQRPQGFTGQPQQSVPPPVSSAPAFNTSRPPQRPVRHSPISDSNVRSIEAMNPYCSPWTIRAIVDSKGDMKTWQNARGSGNLFSVTLKDKTGSIRATAFKEDADRLYKDLQVGQTYLITRGQIKPANKQYCDFHEYEITFGRETQVVAVSSSDLKIEFNMIKLQDLEQKAPNELVDLCGVAASIGDLAEVIARKDNRTLKKRNLTIVDDSNTSVELTLW